VAYWTIRAYGSASRSIFLQQYDDQLADARAKFRTVMNVLRDQPRIEGWSRENGFDRLSGQFRQLGKFRFKADQVQHRPLGFFGPRQMTYTLLIWATERDGSYYPAGVRDTALARMEKIRQDPELAHAFDI